MNAAYTSIPGGAASVLAVAAATSTADPFDKSPLNPINMSRSSANSNASSNAPSSKLLERVRASAADLAELACIQSGWRFVSDKNNTTVYEMSGSALPPTVGVASTFGHKAGNTASDYYLIKGVTSVRADSDRVLAMLAASTTEDFSLRMNQLFGRSYQHGVVIDHMSCTSPPARFQSENGSMHSYTEDDAYAVNWLSLKPSSSSDNFRDFTFASYQDAFQCDPRGALVRLGRSAVREPANPLAASSRNPLAASSRNPLAASTVSTASTGRVLGVHVLSSFNFKDIPELPRTKFTDRLHLRTSGFVVEETHEHGVLRLSFFLSLTPVAATLRHPKKYEKWLQTLALSVGNLAMQLEMPAPTPESQKIQWKNSDHCALCVKSFHTFRRCHHCRFCGESVCNKCSGFVDSSKVPAVRAAAAHDVYTEIRGCKRCIRHLMDEIANTNGLVDGAVRTSTTDSHSSHGSGSGRSSRRARSVASGNRHGPPSPLVVHHYEDDDQSSMDSSSDEYTRLPRSQGHRSTSIPVMRKQSTSSCGDSLTMDDLDVYGGAKGLSSRFSRPPLDPKSSLSMSSASTSQSYDDRVSAGSRGSKMATVMVSADLFSPEDDDDDGEEEENQYVLNERSLAMEALNNSRGRFGLEDHSVDDIVDVDVDYLASRLVQSMVSVKAAATTTTNNHHHHPGSVHTDAYPSKLHNATTALPLQRQTTSSTNSSSSSFKFSLMNAPGHLDVVETPNHHNHHNHADPYAAPYYTGRNQSPAGTPPRAVSSKKLFSISSSGSRQSRPPRFPVDRARSSTSSTNSTKSLRAGDDLMFQLPTSSPLQMAHHPQQPSHDLLIPLPTPVKKDKNDMILLTPVAHTAPQFVEFSDSYRESMDVRPTDIGDMIPLRF